jgi:hypothetical protein
LERSCELQYLWVAVKYRHKNVSQLLMGRALRWCQTEKDEYGPKYDAVRLAILPQLAHAIELARQMGFKDIPPLKFDKQEVSRGRLIFEKRFR